MCLNTANYQKDRTAYYSFSVKNDQTEFAMTVCQQGDRLANYRPKDRDDCYVPTPFSLILIDEDGQIVGETREKTKSNFFHSMLVNKPEIHAG